MNIRLKRTLLSLFFPNRCPVCGEIISAQERFCVECSDKLSPFEGGFRPENTSSFTACYIYDENVIPAIKLLKDGVCGNADFAFGQALADKLREEGIAGHFDLLIPVPMTDKDKQRRSFNQSELLCRIIGSELNVPVCSDAVKKIRRTAPQKELSRELRIINLKGAFQADPSVINGKRVLVVDDICTTGSTISEVAAALISAGAPEVHAAACCKTMKNK
ncbi:MAG TPA: phosphoribosyltransferase family protein [Ruminococcus sp.]|nr:phosphoribosyltransferase family protein [Ruminococcus sp.]